LNTAPLNFIRGRKKREEPAAQAPRLPKPEWLKVRAPGSENYHRLKGLMRGLGLHTVCEEANCPNIGECWHHGTATFMILGDVCTRSCGFCNVTTGRPYAPPAADEPYGVADAAKRMRLRHVVVTSVTRDDLPDGGAQQFADTIHALREHVPGCVVEVLTPDFRGNEDAVRTVVDAKPDYFNHNVETVPRLYPVARRGSKFLRSARVLKMAKEMGGAEVVTKSGLMVGLGESFEEMVETFGLLREHRVQVLTVGQYLRPTENHLPVTRYWHPEEFEALEKAAYELGFESVASGPLVRSSYHADQNLPERALAG
jgi:lipoic acid synthetase